MSRSCHQPAANSPPPGAALMLRRDQAGISPDRGFARARRPRRARCICRGRTAYRSACRDPGGCRPDALAHPASGGRRRPHGTRQMEQVAIPAVDHSKEPRIGVEDLDDTIHIEPFHGVDDTRLRWSGHTHPRARFSGDARFPLRWTTNDSSDSHRAIDRSSSATGLGDDAVSSPASTYAACTIIVDAFRSALRSTPRGEAVPHQERQDVVAVNPFRTGNVDLDLVVEVEHGFRPFPLPQHGIERRDDRARRRSDRGILASAAR